MTLPAHSNRHTQYSHYFQSLVDHHIQVLPSNIGRNRDLNCLALNIYHEARGEPILGQLAVANVTMNRLNNSTNTICQIVYTRGQFAWTSKRVRPPAGDDWRRAQVIAWIVIHESDLVIDVTDNATFFHSYTRTPPSFRRHEHITTIGGHRFYRARTFIEVAQALER